MPITCGKKKWRTITFEKSATSPTAEPLYVMRRILEIVFVLITFGCNAQNVTMLGRYTFYQSEDSIATFSIPQSKTIYNSDDQKIFESYYTELGDSTADIFFEDFEKSPELIVKGFISDGDTSKYIYTEDCSNGEKFIIHDNDTNHRYRIVCINNEVVKIVSTDEFPTSDTLIKEDGKEYWVSTLPDGNKEYSMRQFDSKGRMVLYRWGMTSMSDSEGNFTRYEYDDQNYIETITSSTIGVEDKFGTLVVNYCNKNWITLKREVIELNNGLKTTRRFEYTRIE